MLLRFKDVLKRFVTRRCISRKREYRGHPAEMLEERLMFSAQSVIRQAAVTERLVNLAVPRSQTNQSAASAIAVNDDGMSVIAFAGKGAGDVDGVYARRFDTSGSPIGDPFRTNTTVRGTQTAASVAMDDDGDFAAVWEGRGPGDHQGVFAQWFTASGIASGVETRINTTNGGVQNNATIAMAADGSGAVVWQGVGPGDTNGIFLQRFAANGTKVGGEVRVNTTTKNEQSFPAIAMQATGEFIVTWSSKKQDGSDWGIYGQQFAANGSKAGSEFRINTTTDANQVGSSVAVDSFGDFVVAWSGYTRTAKDWNIFAQQFNATGTKVGDEFRVNETAIGQQRDAKVAMAGNGAFLVTWTGGVPDGSGWEAYARAYRSNGESIDADFKLNSDSSGPNSGHQDYTSVAIGGDSEAVIVWSGLSRLDRKGVILRRFEDEIFKNCGLEEDFTELRNGQGGGTTTGQGTAVVQDCRVTLTEGDSFVVVFEADFTIPETPSGLRISFDNLRFDTTDPNLINDAIEMAVVDQDGNSLVAPFVSGRDSFFNITEGLPAQPGPGVVVEGQTVTVGLNGIPVGTKATVILRLANNDSDTTSTVRITDVDLIDSALAATLPNGSSSTADRRLSAQDATTSSNLIAPSGLSLIAVASDSSETPAANPSAATAPDTVSPTLVTDPNDPRSWQGATVGTFAALIHGSDTVANRQKIIDSKLLDSSRFIAENTFPAQLLPTTWANSTSFAGRSLDTTGTGSYGFVTGSINLFTVANSIDDLWFQSSGRIGDTVFDLGVPSTKAAVFNTIDHGPLPDEAIESTVYLSNDLVQWTPAVLQRVWLEGWHEIAGVLWDGFAFAVGTESGDEFQYVSVIHGGPSALRNDGDDEINGVLGLGDDFLPASATISITASVPATSVEPGTTLLISGVATSRTENGESAEITRVSVNGIPVETLDVLGNFFSHVDVLPGSNEFVIQAFDEFDQTVMTTLVIQGTPRPPNAIDFTRYSDISGSFSGVYGRTSFNEEAKLLHVDLATRNDGQFETDTPLLVGVKNISDPTVSVVGADGFLPDGTPYYDYTQRIPSGKLSPGQLSESPTVTFHNPNRHQFRYELVFLGQLNEPPEITSLPDIEALTGHDYIYDVEAHDPNYDSLTYTLVANPVGMMIVPSSGRITWQPAIANIGQHDLTIRVTDGRGGTAEQHYTLAVIPAPPNRPPVFVTTPVVSVEIGQDYLYDSEAIDADDDSLRYSLVAGPAGMSVDPSSGLVRWQASTETKIAYEAVDLATVANFSLNQLSHQSSDFPEQSFVVNGVPFFIPEASANIWHSEFVGGSNPRVAELPVSSFGVTDVYALINTYWGVSGPSSYAAVEFTGRNGAFYRKPLIGNVDIRDFIQNTFTNSINNTTTVSAFEGTSDLTTTNRMVRLDIVRFSLPDSFANDTLESIRFVDTGGNGFQRIFVSGVTLATAREVGPADDLNVTIAVEDGQGGAAKQDFIACIHADPTNHAPLIVSEPITTVVLPSYEERDVVAYESTFSYQIVGFGGLPGFEQPEFDDSSFIVGQGGFGTPGYGGVSTLTPVNTIWPGNSDILLRKTVTLSPGTTDVNIGVAIDNDIQVFFNGQDVSGGFHTAEGLATYNRFVFTVPDDLLNVGENILAVRARDRGVIAYVDVSVSAYTSDTSTYTSDTSTLGPEYVYDVDAIDPDKDSLRYELISGPPGLTIDSTTGRITGTVADSTVVVFSTDFESGVPSEFSGVTTLESVQGYAGLGDSEHTFSGQMLRNSGNPAGTPNDRTALRLTNLPAHSSVDIGFLLAIIDSWDGDVGVGPDRFNVVVDGQTVFAETIENVFGGNPPNQSYEPSANVQLGAPSRTQRGFSTGAFYSDSAFNLFLEPSLQRIPHTASTLMVEWFANGAGWQGNANGTDESWGLDDVTIQLNVEPQMQPVTVRVVDGRGGIAEQTFTVSLSQGTGEIRGTKFNDLNTNGIRESVIDDNEFTSVVEAEPGLPGWTIYFDQNRNGRLDSGERSTVTDANGDYRFTGLPAGTYVIREEPQSGFQQASPVDGAHRVILSSGETKTEIDFGNVEISGQSNRSPEINSPPSTTVTASELYRYLATADDAENDSLTFDLPLAPNGMTVHPTLGIVVWAPTHEQVGKHQVVLRVRDGNGGIDTQTFVVEVLAKNVAPVFSSVPGTLATAEQPYRDRLAAQDANGDAVRFRLDTPILGMSIETTEIRDFVDSSLIVGRVFDLVWTPNAGQVGGSVVTVTALDGSFDEATSVFTPRGGEASQSFTLTVRGSSVNVAPNITSEPRETAQIGHRYTYLPTVENTDSDPLSYTLVSGPDGMVFDLFGALHWIPTSEQSGTQHIEIQVSDGRGGSDSQVFDIVASALDSNSAPAITSNPPLVTVIGQEFRYNATAIDPDRDPVIWRLVTAPRGMSLDELSGTLRWLPDDDQLGEHTVVLEVLDSSFTSATQRFTVEVRCHNTAPQVVSIPLTSAIVDRNYLYPVRADDFEGDSLTFSLLSAPAGMSIDPQSGLIRWKPTAGQVGTNNVVVQVSDGSDLGTQAYSVVVKTADAPSDPNDPTSPPAGNRPPLVTSSPKFTAEAGTLYQYDVNAVDPDGDAVIFSLSTPPTGMSINGTSGLITWTPIASDVGERIISVVATDIRGARATQSFLLSTKINQPPSITSTAATTVTAGAIYRYTIKATDPDGDPLTFRLNQSPDSMTIDSVGRILWNTTAADRGDHSVIVAVSDNHSQTVTQSFTLAVTADTTAPNVTVELLQASGFVSDGATANLGTPLFFKVLASDNVGVASRTLVVDGQTIPLDAQGQAQVFYTAARLGTINVVATATDAAGNVTQDEMTVTIVDAAVANQPTSSTPGLPPNPGIIDPTDNQSPIVIITSPDNGDSVTDLTPIIGTVDDPENRLWYYQVLIGRADLVNLDNIDVYDPDWKLIRQSTSEVINDELAKLDPSMLSRDPYAIIVVAFDLNGQGYVQPTTVTVEGNVQLGNFHLDFTDLTIPLAGIPIQVIRSYDTLNAGREKDFGFGWNLGIADPRLLETIPQNGEFVSGKTKVYLTNPDGKRVGFTYKEVFRGGFGSVGFFGDGVFQIEFIPDPGVTDKLESNQTSITRGGLSGALGRIVQGSGGVLVNPNIYTLTRPDGTKFVYDQAQGLQTVTDTNGNVLTVTPKGISHSSGESIDFIRDGRGRIVEIRVNSEDLDEPFTLHYEYDAKGDLRTFTNQIGQATYYQYRATPAHYLDKVFDSRNVKVLEVFYNADGTYRGVFDALGNQVNQTDFDIESRTAIVRDSNGNATTLLYNDRGNVIRETDPLGNVTLREYSDPRNPDLETRIIDRNGHVTDRAYDEHGNRLRLSERDSLADPMSSAIVTQFTYDSGNHVTSITNALDRSTTFVYDAAGNVMTITNAEGNSASLTYDEEGHSKTFTDFNGNVTTFEYEVGCGCGRPSKVIFADGTFQVFEYNVYGQVTVEEFHEANGTLVERTQTTYDSLGRVTEVKRGADGTPNHPPTIVRKFYDGNLLDYEIIVNPLSPNETPATPVAQRQSRITDYEYDPAGRIIRQTDAMGGVVEFRYDANGNRILLQDPVGNITTWVYDADNRIIEERDPFYWEGMTIAQVLPVINDPSGGSTVTNTPAAHVRLYGYDAEGNQTEVIDRNGRRREFDYDQAGRITQERWYEAGTDTLVRTIAFAYDLLGNMLTADDPDSHYAFTYDTRNRLHSVDNAETPGAPNVILTYAYDAQGNVTSTSDNYGVTVASTYNQRNLLQTRTWFDAIVGTGRTPDVDPVRVDFHYNAAGRESEITRWSGLTQTQLVARTVRTYDLAGRSDLLSHRTAVGEILSQYDYDYDFSGLLKHEARTHQDAQFNQTIDYRYDLTGQLTNADFTGQTDEHYVYDANGNRITSQVGSESRTYSTGPANELRSDGEFNYEYDAEGNLTKRVTLINHSVRINEYDHHNRLVRVSDWSSDPEASAASAAVTLRQRVEYTFDVLGQRIAIRVDSDGDGPQDPNINLFVYSHSNVWADSSAVGAIAVRYLFGNSIDHNVARHSIGQSVIWYLVDRQHTPRDLATPQGSVVVHTAYTTFGTTLQQFGEDLRDRFAFTGRELDSATNDYFYRSRVASSSNARFHQNDLFGFDANDPNLYRFVFNSPTNGTDPTGNVVIGEYSLQLGVGLGLVSSTASVKVYIICTAATGEGDTITLTGIAKAASIGFVAGFVIGSGFLQYFLLSTNQLVPAFSRILPGFIWRYAGPITQQIVVGQLVRPVQWLGCITNSVILPQF